MKRTEKRSREFDHVTSYVCDWCGAEAGAEWHLPYPEGDKRNNQTVQVEATVCDAYPEGSFGWRYVVDLCARCFVDRLVPFLKSEGAEVRKEEVDW